MVLNTRLKFYLVCSGSEEIRGIKAQPLKQLFFLCQGYFQPQLHLVQRQKSPQLGLRSKMLLSNDTGSFRSQKFFVHLNE